MIPAGSALGRGSAGAFVHGFHHAILAGSALAAAGALLSAWLIGVRRTRPGATTATTVTPAAPAAPDPAGLRQPAEPHSASQG
jgi:hypothetical protein